MMELSPISAPPTLLERLVVPITSNRYLQKLTSCIAPLVPASFGRFATKATLELLDGSNPIPSIYFRLNALSTVNNTQQILEGYQERCIKGNHIGGNIPATFFLGRSCQHTVVVSFFSASDILVRAFTGDEGARAAYEARRFIHIDALPHWLLANLEERANGTIKTLRECANVELANRGGRRFKPQQAQLNNEFRHDVLITTDLPLKGFGFNSHLTHTMLVDSLQKLENSIPSRPRSYFAATSKESELQSDGTVVENSSLKKAIVAFTDPTLVGTRVRLEAKRMADFALSALIVNDICWLCRIPLSVEQKISLSTKYTTKPWQVDSDPRLTAVMKAQGRIREGAFNVPDADLDGLLRAIFQDPAKSHELLSLYALPCETVTTKSSPVVDTATTNPVSHELTRALLRNLVMTRSDTNQVEAHMWAQRIHAYLRKGFTTQQEVSEKVQCRENSLGDFIAELEIRRVVRSDKTDLSLPRASNVSAATPTHTRESTYTRKTIFAEKYFSDCLEEHYGQRIKTELSEAVTMLANSNPAGRKLRSVDNLYEIRIGREYRLYFSYHKPAAIALRAFGHKNNQEQILSKIKHSYGIPQFERYS